MSCFCRFACARENVNGWGKERERDVDLKVTCNERCLVAVAHPADEAHHLARQEDVGRVDARDEHDDEQNVKDAHLGRLEHVQGRVEQVLHVEPVDIVVETFY